MLNDVDQKLWPFEAMINHGDGSEFCQYARDNGDGTITVYKFNPPNGFEEITYPKECVTLGVRPTDKAQRWHELYKRVYGGNNGLDFDR